MEETNDPLPDSLVHDESTAIKLYLPDLVKERTFHDLETKLVLSGHTAPVRFVLHHENKLYSSADDCRIIAWDPETGELESEFIGHSDSVCYLAAYKDRLYSGSWDKTIRIWDLHTKECIHILKGHTDTISCISVDSTGIYTASFDRSIRVWDHQTFVCRHTWTGHSTRVLTILRHEDLLYSTSLDKVIKVWNIHSGFVEDIVDIAYGTRSLHIDGNLLYCGCDDGWLIIYDLQEKTKVFSLSTTYVLAHWVVLPEAIYVVSYTRKFIIQFDRDLSAKIIGYKSPKNVFGHTNNLICIAHHNGQMFTASVDKTVRVWGKKSIARARVLRGHKSEVYTVKVAGKYAYTTSLDETIRKWDTETGAVVGTMQGHEAQIFMSALAYDKLVTASWDKTLRVWDTHTCTCEYIFRGHTSEVMTVLLHNGHVYSGDWGGNCIVWDLKTGKIFGQVQSPNPKGEFDVSFMCFAITKDESFLYGATHGVDDRKEDDGEQICELVMYSINHNWKMELVRNVKYTDPLNFIRMSPDEKYIVCGSTKGWFQLVDPKDLSKLKTFQIHEPDLYIQMATMKGPYCFSVGSDKTLRLWELETGKQLYRIEAHEDVVYDIALDGDKLYTCSGDGITIIYDLQSILKPDFFNLFDNELTLETLESRDLLDRSPLMALFSHGFSTQVESILEKYPTINLLDKNNYGENCLYFAIKNRQWNLLKQLSKRPEIANRGVYSSKNTCLFQYLNTMSLHEDVEFYEKLWENTGLKPQVDILGQSLMGYEPPLGLMEKSIHKYGVLNSRSRKERKTLLHYACLYGTPSAVEKLVKYDSLKVNEQDCEMNTPLHYCFTLENNNKDIVSEISYLSGLRDENEIKLERLEAAKLLITCEDSTKKPHLLTNNKKGKKPYLLALEQYEECRQKLKEKEESVERVNKTKKEFEAISEVIDACNDYSTVKRFRESFAWKMFLNNAVPYLIWLLLLTVVAIGQSVGRYSSKSYFLTQTIENSLAGWDGVVDQGSFWGYLGTNYIPALQSQNWGDVTYNPSSVSGGLRIIGGAQLVQVRVHNKTCSSQINDCVSPLFDELKTPYGPNNMFTWSENTDGYGFDGPTGDRYPKSGYVQIISPMNSTDIISSLQSNGWIDGNTRAIILRTNVYDPSLNLLAVSSIIFEFPSSGSVVTSDDIITVQAYRYHDGYDWFILALQIICILYFVYEFVWQEIKEIAKDAKLGHFVYYKDVWNYYEWLIIGIFTTIVILHIITITIQHSFDFLCDGNTYLNVYELGKLMVVEESMFAAFIIISWMRYLKFLKIPPYTGPAAVSIIETMTDNSFIVFVIVCILVIFAMAIAFHVALGTSQQPLNRFDLTLMTLLRGAVFGDFDYEMVGNSSIGIVLYLFMKLFFSTLLLTIFIAVISDIYIKLQEANEQRWELYVTKLLIETFQKPQKMTIWDRLRDYYNRKFSSGGRKNYRRSVPMLVVDTGSVFSGTTLSSDVELKEKNEEAPVVDDDNEEDEDELDTVEAPVYDDDALDDMILDLRTKRMEMSMKQDIAHLKTMMQEIQKKIM